MSTKLNISIIIKDHFKTMKNHRTEKFSKFDALSFIFLPALAAAAIAYHYTAPKSEFITSLITASSIFIGLLLNLLVLLYQITTKNRDRLAESPGNKHLTTKRDLLREINANISYSILLLSLLVVSCIAMTFSSQMSQTLQETGYLVIYFLAIHFLLNLIMILKRVYALIAMEPNR